MRASRFFRKTAPRNWESALARREEGRTREAERSESYANGERRKHIAGEKKRERKRGGGEGRGIEIEIERERKRPYWRRIKEPGE